MNPIIKNIKQQYFTLQNINFICQILYDKYNIEIDKDKLFKIQNSTFNNFLDKMYDKEINIQLLDKLLVELNKLTIQLYLTPEIPIQIKQNENENENKNENENQQNRNEQNTNEQNTNENEQNTNENQQSIKIVHLLPQQDTINLDSVRDLIKELVYESKISNDTTVKEIIEIKEIIKSLSVSNKKSNNDENNNDENNNDKEFYLDLYSISSKYDDKQSSYEFTLDIPLQNFTINDFKIYSNDTFNNINEHNNKILLVENHSKTKIVIPQGNYTIQDLIDIIEKLINEKSVFKSYKILYDKNKNRIQISNDKSFNITFIENGLGVQLKDILGYSKNEYNSNTNYLSENEPINNIFNEIYIKSSDHNLNKFYTNLSINNSDNNINRDINDKILFKYFYSNIKSNTQVKPLIWIKEPVYNMNIQLYYKLNNRIIKFVKKIDFNILLKVNVIV